MARGPREGTDTRDATVRDESEEDRVVGSPGQADPMDLGLDISKRRHQLVLIDEIGGNFPGTICGKVMSVTLSTVPRGGGSAWP